VFTTRDSFLDFITAERLYAAATVFGILTAIIVALIYLYLYQKKNRHFTREKIAQELDEWIGEALLEEEGAAELTLSPFLTKELEKAENRQFVIERLISVRKNLTGQAAANISRLYEKLKLRKDSLEKYNDRAWYRKAKGIYELYMMDQRDMQGEIFKHTNSENEIIRTEAQTAIISFQGFEGLKFLDTLSYPLTDWQQLKIVEQLKAIDPQDITQIAQWLRSDNEYVVLAALRLAEIFYQLHAHDDILHCLDHKNEKVRRQAAVTFARLANESTSKILVGHYPSETFANQRNILQQLFKIADDNETAFLKQQLENPDDLLKLEAARAMARNCAGGYDILKQKADVQPDPYLHIYNHVKQELTR
jgi:hypothetical protein